MTILIARAIGMSLLLLRGVLIVLSGNSGTKDTGIAVVGLVVVAGAGAVPVRRDLLMSLIGSLVRSVKRLTGRPRDEVAEGIASTLGRMGEIPLKATSTLEIIGLATGVWFLDFCCLACSCGAVHARVLWSGVPLAYGVAQIVVALPIVPGGVGFVEGSLAAILVAYGVRRIPALSVVLDYRLRTFWFAGLVGWLSVGLIAWQARKQVGLITADAVTINE